MYEAPGHWTDQARLCEAWALSMMIKVGTMENYSHSDCRKRRIVEKSVVKHGKRP